MKKILVVLLSSLLGGMSTYSAHALNDDKLNELKTKYNLNNPNSKRTSQSTIQKIRDKNYSKTSGATIEQDIINKHYVDQTDEGRQIDLSRYQNTDIKKRYTLGIAEAKQIAGKAELPTMNEDNSVNVSYYENGEVNIKRDANGRIVFSEKTAEEKGQRKGQEMSATEIVGNDIEHSDNQAGGGSEFTAGSHPDSDIAIKSAVQGNLNYYQQSSEGTGTMAVDSYKAIVKGAEENQMYIDQDTPLLNASYTAVGNVNAEFNDCEDVTRTIEVEETFPRETLNYCAVAISPGPSFCELRREVVKQSSITFFTASVDARQRYFNEDGLYSTSDLENQRIIKGYKHSDTFESGHWDTYRVESQELGFIGGALVSKEVENDEVAGKYTEELNFYVGITPYNGKSWNGVNYNTYTAAEFLFNNNTGSALFDAEVELGVTGAWNYTPRFGQSHADSNSIELDGSVNYHWAYDIENTTSDDAALFVIRSAKVDLNSSSIEPSSYSIGVHTNDEAEGNLTKRTVLVIGEQCTFYDPDSKMCMGSENVVSQYYEFYYGQAQLSNGNRNVSVKDYLKDFMTLDSVGMRLTMEVYSNNQLQDFRWPHKESQNSYKRLDLAYSSNDSGEMRPLPKLLTFRYTQPSMVVETVQAYFPEGCMDKVTAAEPSCTFDGTYTILDEGTRGYPNIVLSEMLPLFTGDTGYRTWIAEANNYKCDPFDGGTRTIDGVSYTWEDVVDRSPGCGEYSSNIQCTEVESSCDFYDENDPSVCLLESRTYSCNEGYTQSRTIEVTTNTCDMELPCTGGECETQQDEVNEKFDETMVGLSLAQGVKTDRGCTNEADPDTCVVFQGEARQCRYESTFSLGNNCCKAPGGVNPVEFVAATWQMGKVTGINDYLIGVGENAANVVSGGWDMATTYLANTEVGQSVSSAFTDISKSLTNVYDSIAGNAAKEVGTTAGSTVLSSETSNAASEAAIKSMSEKTYEYVYNALPEDLSSLLIKRSDDGLSYALSDGVNQTFTYMGYIATAYSYYTYFKLALNLATQCNDDEDSPEYDIDMGVLIGNRQCMYVDKAPVGALGIQKEQYHCCFESPLARIVMEQALPQLGYGSKQEYRDAGCPGMTPQQMSQLDWELIELDEWHGLLAEAGILPDTTSEESLTGSGRLVNGELRQTATERTLERLNSNDGIIERQKQVQQDMQVDNVDCSVSPRPAVCDYTGGSKLKSDDH